MKLKRGVLAKRGSLVFISLLLSWVLGEAQDRKLRPLHVSYSSQSGTRAPLWIAKDARIFEKYGLDVSLTRIASGSASYSALLGGNTQIVSDTASAAVAAGARAPIVIFAGSGPIAYKLVAHPSITSIEGLKGKIVGSSFVGAGSDYLLRQLLPKLGLIPGKDVTLIPTGLGESDKRLMVMFHGRIDATLATEDNLLQMELKGQKISVLADFIEMGVYTTGGDFATTRQFLSEQRKWVKAFLMALSEGIWLGRTNQEMAFQVFRKYLGVEHPKLLESMHKNYLLGTIPQKPYPLEAAVEIAIDEVSLTQPLVKGRKPADFIDVSILKEIESEGFFARLQR